MMKLAAFALTSLFVLSASSLGDTSLSSGRQEVRVKTKIGLSSSVGNMIREHKMLMVDGGASSGNSLRNEVAQGNAFVAATESVANGNEKGPALGSTQEEQELDMDVAAASSSSGTGDLRSTTAHSLDLKLVTNAASALTSSAHPGLRGQSSQRSLTDCPPATKPSPHGSMPSKTSPGMSIGKGNGVAPKGKGGKGTSKGASPVAPGKGKGQVGSESSKGTRPKGSKTMAKSSKGGCGKGGCSKSNNSKDGCGKGGCSKVNAKSSKGGCGKGGCGKSKSKSSKGGCGKGGCGSFKAKSSKGGCGKGGCGKSKSKSSKGGCGKGGCGSVKAKSSKGGSKLPGKGKGQVKASKKSSKVKSKTLSPKPPSPTKPTSKCPGSPTTFPTANIEMPPDDTCERQCMQWVYQNCVVLDELGDIMEDHCIVPFPFDDDLFGRSLAGGFDTDTVPTATEHPFTVQDKIEYHRKMAYIYEQVLSLID